MNEELKVKINQLIESNFAKSESEILVKLINDHGELKTKADGQEKTIEIQKKATLELITDRDNWMVKTVHKDEEIQKLKDENFTIKQSHDDMKEKFVSIKLEAAEKSLDQIFQLASIAFKTPAKLKTFDKPMVRENWGSSFSNGQEQPVRHPDSIENGFGSETEDVVQTKQ